LYYEKPLVLLSMPRITLQKQKQQGALDIEFIDSTGRSPAFGIMTAFHGRL